MIISFPTDCDNAPKRRLIKDFVIAVFQNKWTEIEPILDDEIEFYLVGKDKIVNKLILEKYLLVKSEISKIKINEILSHGKFGACNGYLTTNTEKVDFAYFFEFKSAGKNKILKIHEYRIFSDESASL